jgi:hypothetical protein
MAEAIGWGKKPLGWADILALARNPKGWQAYGYPQWVGAMPPAGTPVSAGAFTPCLRKKWAAVQAAAKSSGSWPLVVPISSKLI